MSTSGTKHLHEHIHVAEQTYKLNPNLSIQEWNENKDKWQKICSIATDCFLYISTATTVFIFGFGIGLNDDSKIKVTVMSITISVFVISLIFALVFKLIQEKLEHPAKDRCTT